MVKSFTTSSALASVLVALATAAGAGPVQLAQVNLAPKIQPAPPPNLARTPVITPQIDTRRLADEKDEDGKEADAHPEQVPQEAAPAADAPQITRQSPPPAAARVTRAPLPLARPELFEGLDPTELIDARGAAEAREAAEAAAMAGVGVERSDLGGLGDPMAGDDEDGPGDPRFGGMSPEEFKERFGLGGPKSPEEVAAGMATRYNDLGNRGVDSPTGEFTAGLRPDPTTIPRGDLASDKPYTAPDGTETVRLPGEDDYVSNRQTGWHHIGDGVTRNVTQKERADGSGIEIVEQFYPSGARTRSVVEYDSAGVIYDSDYVHRSPTGQVTHERGQATGERFRDMHFDRMQTPETAGATGGGCAPNDGSAACQEFRRLTREGNTADRLIAGGRRVNPGDPDDGATGDAPRIWMSEEDLLGNPDPHSLGHGGAGSRQGINDGKHINVEGGGTGTGQ